MTTLYNFILTDIEHHKLDLFKFKGKFVLFVNVASKCGYTKQYAGLEELYKKYRDQGFVVVGAPSNQFSQEPGNEEEIKKFCASKYGVTFPLTAKINVGGVNEDPIYMWLRGSQHDGIAKTKPIKWNFEKFLIDREGKVICHYDSKTEPKSIASDIEALI